MPTIETKPDPPCVCDGNGWIDCGCEDGVVFVPIDDSGDDVEEDCDNCDGAGGWRCDGCAAQWDAIAMMEVPDAE